jgi:hypothetical protein
VAVPKPRSERPLVVLIVFGILAFSGEVADAAVDIWNDAAPDLVFWTVGIAVDSALIWLLWHVRVRPSEIRPGPPPPPGRTWLLSGGLFIALDGIRLPLETLWDPPVLLRIASLLLYLPLLLALYTYARGWPFYRPFWRWLRGDRDDPDRERIVRDTVLPALPLVAGAGVAWTAGVLWTKYIEPVQDEGVDPEFFAQMSAVIPVLLLALVVEARVLRASHSVPRARRELNLYVVVVLVLGEAMALSTLPIENQVDAKGNGRVLTDWHEYIAFDLSVFAVAIALATIVLLAAGGLREEEPETLRVRLIQ